MVHKTTSGNSGEGKEGSSENPKVSIIVAVYQEREDWFIQLLDSLCQQDYENKEIIVSGILNDPCLEVCKLFDDIKIVEGRIPNAKMQLNTAIKNSSGDYILGSGSDDYWYESALSGMMNVLREKKAVFVYPDIEYCDDRLSMAYTYQYPEKFSMDELMKHQAMTDCSLIEKALFWEYGFLDESLDKFAFWDFFLKVAQKYGYRIHHYPHLAFKYRRHADSLGRTGRGEEFRERFYEKWGITYRYKTMPPSFKAIIT